MRSVELAARVAICTVVYWVVFVAYESENSLALDIDLERIPNITLLAW